MVRVQKFGNFRYRKGQLVWKLRNHYDWGPSTNSISRASVFLFYFQKLLLSLDHNVSYKNGEGISHAGTSLGLQNISCKYSLYLLDFRKILLKKMSQKKVESKKSKKKMTSWFFQIIYRFVNIFLHAFVNFDTLSRKFWSFIGACSMYTVPCMHHDYGQRVSAVQYIQFLDLHPLFQ